MKKHILAGVATLKANLLAIPVIKQADIVVVNAQVFSELTSGGTSIIPTIYNIHNEKILIQKSRRLGYKECVCLKVLRINNRVQIPVQDIRSAELLNRTVAIVEEENNEKVDVFVGEGAGLQIISRLRPTQSIVIRQDRKLPNTLNDNVVWFGRTL